MNCAEFQKVLPDLLDRGGDATQEAHLRSCPDCSELVADLNFITQQAKQLLPSYDPHPRVWEGIRAELEREGLIQQPPAATRQPRPFSHGIPWLIPAAAVVLLALGAFLYRHDFASSGNSTRSGLAPSAGQLGDGQAVALSAQQASSEDERLILQIAAENPSLRNTYENNLKLVNAYISDAERSVQQNPNDEEARQSLIQAYDQKAMIYQMGLTRSLE